MAVTPVLTDAEKEHFLTHGWVKIPGAFTKEQAEGLTKDVWTRLGISPTDKSTWDREWTNMPSHTSFDCSTFAPRAWAAICELLGGEDRIKPETRQWRDSLIVNLGSAEGAGKRVPPQDLQRWHVDGDWFTHYLDSPEQGLLVTPLFTDIVEGGGGTAICPEAIPKVAKWLHDHPEGVSPRMIPRGQPGFEDVAKDLTWFNELAKTCTKFLEVTGNVGDVFLMHPLMLHCATGNPLRNVRIITNPPVSINEPFRFDREDGDFSLVERATLRALSKDRLDGWTAQGPRERRVPFRVAMQEQMKIEETKRLEASRQVKVQG